MLKIELIETSPEATALQLEGELIGPWVEELGRSAEAALVTGARLALDLRAVSFVDRQGVELLLRLMSRQVTLLNCSCFVAEQIRA